VGDAWLAAENAVLYAETLGIGSCFNGLVATASNNSAHVKTALGIPKQEKVVCALTLGYPKLHFAREAPRKRMETVWH
jgi:nitroreductase